MKLPLTSKGRAPGEIMTKDFGGASDKISPHYCRYRNPYCFRVRY